ncbi:MAG TPA: ribosome small subunit-dependent GTPase A [Eubacteriaceae bacterium]|nr:ribosome small subunit-dependent GTPase A [Eubacteriaceae bacterium]
MKLLKSYGLTDRYINESSIYEGLRLARVIAQYKGLYKIITDNGERKAQISGKLRHETTELSKFPAVGDFVMVSYEKTEDTAVIHHILTRKSVFLRTAVGIKDQAQVVASNVDSVFICMSLNSNYNLNRLERYLSIAWDSGATPVIVLTKSDLCENLTQVIQEVEQVSFYSDIITTSMFENNIDKFKPYLKEGITAAFIGSSGVGKSTLINQMLEKSILETKETGKDDKGRHTTTGREMFPTILGGVVIDTPGMRELGVQSADLSRSFADIERLAQHCKFNDCSHTNEPGCAIQNALSEGRIDQRRLNSYIKLKNEASYEGLNSKQIESQKLERMFKEVGGMKNARKFAKKRKDG